MTDLDDRQKRLQGVRVVLVVTSSVSAEKFLPTVANFLVRQGCAVTVLADDAAATAGTHWDSDVALRSISMRREASLLGDGKALLEIIGVLRTLQPDVVVYATPKASLLTAIASLLTRVPVRVYQIWGLRLETTRGVTLRLLAATESVIATCSTHVLANSASLARAYGVRVVAAKEVKVLGSGSSHGVDLARYSRHQKATVAGNSLFAAAPLTPPVLAFVGRLHPDKGVDTLIDAVMILVTRGFNFTLVLAGPDEGVEVLPSLGNDLPIHFLGPVKDPRQVYAVSDVLVLPSRREGFPNVVLEAAAMEVPAVVTDATGVVDSVVDGVTGLIVQTNDPTALADALARLLGDDSLRRKMGRAARARAVAEFSSEHVASNFADFIESAIHQH